MTNLEGRKSEKIDEKENAETLVKGDCFINY